MGFPYLMLNRSDFCRVLYDDIADKSMVKTSKRVVSVEQGDGYAKVVLADGTEEVGDIIVGCDGVYSAVRGAVKQTEGAKVVPVTTSKDASREYLAHYVSTNINLELQNTKQNTDVFMEHQLYHQVRTPAT